MERSQTDFNILDYTDCLLYTSKELNISMNYYFTSASLIRYMIETYGVEEFWSYVGNQDSFAEIYGMSLVDMLEEWNSAVISKFQ